MIDNIENAYFDNDQKAKVLVTSPIYYPNSKLHVGNCYTNIVCDMMNRYEKNFLGNNSVFLTGTDEHGSKLEGKQEEIEITVTEIKKLWEHLDVEYDYFIRTTDKTHIDKVLEVFQRLLTNNDIYESVYSGNYCVSCESFVVNGGKCPDCGRGLISFTERCFYFRTSKYAEQIMNFINSGSIYPEFRRTEMLNFVGNGIQDFVITRSSVKNGISLSALGPKFERLTVYVWFDALINYISNPLYCAETSMIHVLGKDISRFHSVIWIAMISALNLKLPSRMIIHGWILDSNNDKVSKSKNNCSIEPILLNSDALRYYLFRDIPFGHDGNFKYEDYLMRHNTELVRGYGNLISRIVKLYKLSIGDDVRPLCCHICAGMEYTVNEYNNLMSAYRFTDALKHLHDTMTSLNKYISDNKLWENPKDKTQITFITYHKTIMLMNLMSPFTPSFSERGIKILNELSAEHVTESI